MEDGRQGFLVNPAEVAGALRRRAAHAARRRRRCARGWPTRAAAPRSSTTRGRPSPRHLETYYTDLIAGRRPVWASARSLTRFVALSIVVVPDLGHRRRSRWATSSATRSSPIALIALFAVAWGAFTPNSPLFGPVIARGKAPSPKAAITFDDGPSDLYTPPILDALRDRGAKATFFVLGRNVRAHPEIARRIVDEGHELASHGDDHSIMTFDGPKAIAHQLRSAEEAVVEAVGAAAGAAVPHAARLPQPVPDDRRARLGYRVVGWTAGVWDTALPGVERIVGRSVSRLKPGAILLLHDADGIGQRRRPHPDRRGAAADHRPGPRARPRVRDRVRAGRGAAAAAADAAARRVPGRGGRGDRLLRQQPLRR